MTISVSCCTPPAIWYVHCGPINHSYDLEYWIAPDQNMTSYEQLAVPNIQLVEHLALDGTK